MAQQQAPQRVLLTGGADYIGSDTFSALREAGFEPVVWDNFANGHPKVLLRLERTTGRAPLLEHGDLLDTRFLEAALRPYRPPPSMTPRLWRSEKLAAPCPWEGVKSTINVPGRRALAERQPGAMRAGAWAKRIISAGIWPTECGGRNGTLTTAYARCRPLASVGRR